MPARIHRRRRSRAQTRVERGLVGRRRSRAFAAWHAQPVVGHARGAVEPRRDRARADGVLVDVDDLGLAERRRAPAARKDAATSPALSGVVANTPECIFTPVGMPRIGHARRRRRRGCRAPCRRRRRRGSGRRRGARARAAAARVSAAVVGRRAPADRQHLRLEARARRRGRRPSRRRAATTVTSARRRSSRASARSARSAATGVAPSARARASDVGAVGSLQADAAAHARRSG